MTYTAESVEASLAADRERLFFPWTVGRSRGWTCDDRTRDTVCLSYWIREQLLVILGAADEEGRKTQEAWFHRRSRSEEDLFAVAAEILNDAVAGNIARDRRPHRRWG